MSSGELSMSDSVGPTMAMGGGALTFTPVVIIQIIGAVVGVAGVILTFMRVRESKLSRMEQARANDINEARLQFERERHAKAENNLTSAQDCKEDSEV